MNFKKNLFLYNPENLSEKVMDKITKEYTSNPQWVLPKIEKASKAGFILATWAESIIKYCFFNKID